MHKKPSGGVDRLTGVSTGQGGVHLMWAKRPHLRIIVIHQHSKYNYNQIRDVAYNSGIQRLYETSPRDKICQFYSLSQVNYHIMSTKSEGWGGVICIVKIDPLKAIKTLYKIYMGSFPIINGVQGTNLCK